MKTPRRRRGPRRAPADDTTRASLPPAVRGTDAKGHPPDGHDVRARAAAVLADVVAGASLRERLKPAQAKLDDVRDRALLTALVSEGARWWLRFDPVLDNLLQRPLRQREPALHALLILGLVQLEILQVPAHAAVAATVDATRALGRGGFDKLANAVLRRWQRERGAWIAQLHRAPVTRTAHPRWLVDALSRDWPGQADAILTANNAPPPPMLRVNARRSTRAATLTELAATGLDATPYPWLSDAIALAVHADIAHLQGFAAGRFSVQDGAAQCAVDLLELGAGLRVLDACAAPGGKTCHALERADLDLLALDREPARAASIETNLHRLGLACDVRTANAGDPSGWWNGKRFDRILLDAPCSATGVIRRHPDIKLHRRASDIDALARIQAHLLGALWPLLAPGGRLVYATCSLLRQENERVIAAFLTGRDDARPRALELPAGHRAGPGWQILPGEDGLDGMFYAVLDKPPA